MNFLIKQDSYWQLEGEGEKAEIKAICVICFKKSNLGGWFWGGRLGYGNYDLFCSSCGNAIYIRGENESKADNKDDKEQK